MRPVLQEAQFACFEDDENDGSSLPSFVLSSPLMSSQAPKSYARVRALECTGSGSFYFQNEHLRDRFVCWRILKNVVLLREWSLNITLKQNGIRLEFPAPVVATGVFVVESWEDDAVVINIVTHAGTIHRLTYSVPSVTDLSIFSQSDVKAFPTPKPATRCRFDVLQSLNTDEIVTAALWVNEYNLVVGTDTGRVLGVNFGVPCEPTNLQEFIFSDKSVVGWLWHGFIKSTAAKLKGSSDDHEKRNMGAAVIAMTCLEISGDDDEKEGEREGEKDVCVITISADCVLRAWSFGFQSCLGHQELRHLVTGATNDEDRDDEELETFEDRDSTSQRVYAVHAKVVALSPTESDNCRLLIHLDTTAAYSSEIFLLRGDVRLTAVSSAGAGEELALDVARVFTVDPCDQKPKRRLQLVDFAVDKAFLFSSWRSLEGDQVFIHPNPMALTGPKRISGQVVDSLTLQMKKYEKEDSEWLFDLKEEGIKTQIDDFFLQRILLPGRFSKRNVSNAMLETQTNSARGGDDISVSNYSDTLLRLISNRCDQVTNVTVLNESAHNIVRIRMWKDFIALCTTHWQTENVPLGFATSTNTLLPGAPVFLRRNRLSLFFPAASSITAGFFTQTEQKDLTLTDCLTELVTDILPLFDAFSSQRLQSFSYNDIRDVATESKGESLVALARHSVRLGLSCHETGFTRAIVRLHSVLSGDFTVQEQLFNALIHHIWPLKQQPYSTKTALIHENDTWRAVFASHEMNRAVAHVLTSTIAEMCSQSLRVVLLLAFLIETRPAFLASQTLSLLLERLLPHSISIYQRWQVAHGIATQGRSTTSSLPLLQYFVKDMTPTIHHLSEPFQRSLSVLHLATTIHNAHDVLATFTRELLALLALPTPQVFEFLKQRQHLTLVRALYCVQLRELREVKDDRMLKTVRALGECLAAEARCSLTDLRAQEHTSWCVHHALRCFRLCLSTFLVDHERSCSRSFHEFQHFVYDVVGILKDTMGRHYVDHLLSFLWTVGTQTLRQGAQYDHDEHLVALQSFIWINVLKYSVHARRFRDAHLALMHTTELLAVSTGSDAAREAEATATECVSFFVKELVRTGELALVCELQWGAYEQRVEEHLLWQAAHSTVDDKLKAQYYHLLYTFYMRKQQPANAASSLYALARRLRLAHSTSKNALEVQRNALNAACSALRLLPRENRWIVRKLHVEERVVESKCSLSVITLEEIHHELTVLDAKLYLVNMGHTESMLLSTMTDDDVIALLVDAIYKSSFEPDATLAERRHKGMMALELALPIARKQATDDWLTRVTKSLTRCAMAREEEREGEEREGEGEREAACDLVWTFLELFLDQTAPLEQYQVAAETVLEAWQGEGKKRRLPAWLHERIASAKKGNPAMLLRLYLKHGLLLEGQELVDKLLTEAEDMVDKPPYIPYHVVDVLLNSISAIVANPPATIPSTTVANLHERDQKLRQHLARYFESLHARQEAQETLSYAQQSVDMEQ